MSKKASAAGLQVDIKIAIAAPTQSRQQRDPGYHQFLQSSSKDH
jgi:hypothetical protein